MEEINNFFAMGGHGFYIWLSYGVAVVVMLVEAFLVWQRHKKARQSFEKLKLKLSAQEETV